MIELIFILAVTALGAVAGAKCSTIVPAPPFEIVIGLASIGGVFGALSAYGLLTVFRSFTRRPRHLPTQTLTTSRHHPRSFRGRLAAYFHRDENEVMVETETFRSKMPFWTAVNSFCRLPTRSADMIRQKLLRIKRTLNGQ